MREFLSQIFHAISGGFSKRPSKAGSPEKEKDPSRSDFEMVFAMRPQYGLSRDHCDDYVDVKTQTAWWSWRILSGSSSSVSVDVSQRQVDFESKFASTLFATMVELDTLFAKNERGEYSLNWVNSAWNGWDLWYAFYMED